MTTDNLTTTVNIHRFSSIFTHFHSFSHVVITHFSLIIHMLSLLIFTHFHSFSLIFTHFLLFVVGCHVVAFFYKSFPVLGRSSWTFTHFHSFLLIFTHFYSFPQFHTCFSSFFTLFVVGCHVVAFFYKSFPVLGRSIGHFPEHMNNRKF